MELLVNTIGPVVAAHKWLFVFLHVMSVVIAMGAAFTIDFLTAYFAKNRTFSAPEVRTLRFLITIVSYGLFAILITGALVFTSAPEKYLASSKFLTKITVVLVLCANGYVLHRFVFQHIGLRKILELKKFHRIRRVAFVCGAISATSWASALLLALQASIPFSVGQALVLYGGVLMVAVGASIVLLRVLRY